MGTVHTILEAKGRQAALEAGFRRPVVDTASLYMSDEDNGFGFAYSGWSQCALPHSRQPESAAWSITSENVRLVVEPGRRASPDSDDVPEFVGVPFGTHARLILLFLQTEALRTGSREVVLGGSLREWLARIGVSYGGSTAKSVRDQAERISLCKMTFHFRAGQTTGMVNQTILDRAIFFEPIDREGRQGRLSFEAAKLSEGFFEQLKRHPVPLEEAAIKALNKQAAALDCYLWLAYRLHALPSDRLVTWKALKGQFGPAFSELWSFKAKFSSPTGPLALALAVYPDAKVEVAKEGVILKPSRPPVSPRIIGLSGA